MKLSTSTQRKEPFKIAHHALTTKVILSLICCCVVISPDIASALQTANTEATLGVTLRVEHDDNVDLVNDAEKKDNLIRHLIPKLDMTHFFNEHNLNLLFKGDYRKGVDVVDGETNLEAGIGVDFNFSGGLMIGLSNTFIGEKFDQHLYTETGVSDSQKNIYTIKTAYSFGERTTAEASYSYKWEEYDDEPKKNMYHTDMVNGRATIPVSTRWKSYLKAELETLQSDGATTRNNDAVQGILGFIWEGPNRFSCWLEGGFGEIDYENEEIEDRFEAIEEIGGKIELTPWSFFQASVGRNSYGSLKYSGIFRHSFQDKIELTLQTDRERTQSYTLNSMEESYDVTTFLLTLNSTFLERIEIGLKASYQIQDQTDSVETFIGKATLNYSIQKRIKIGAHYQYAARIADIAEEEYNDNRVGFFATLSL